MAERSTEESRISEQLAQVLREVCKVREQVEEVKHHPSQNGGWEGLMELVRNTNEHLLRIDRRLDDMEEALKNPTDGTMAQIKELREWRDRANATLDGNAKQDERLLRIELQLQLYNKVTWAIGLGVLGLIVKAFMSLIVPVP